MEEKFKVYADPAKSFFVSMLIKDITLRDAIGDLVDNAVDAIKKVAPDKKDLSQYKIEISLNDKEFSISDNGSGLDVDTAKYYAFNFGHAKEHKLMPNSIGQFGIGMKRAFFKIGSEIHVHSVTENSAFDIDINVNEWIKEEKDWTFSFREDSLTENVPQDAPTGLKITINNLSHDARSNFDKGKFREELIKEITLEQLVNIEKGLKIVINGQSLNKTDIGLISNDTLKPAIYEEEWGGLKIKILAGISKADKEAGGWYIFCNDRLILAKDKSANTAWTGGGGDGAALWHSQYQQFRGYAFLEAQESSNLPWNTTKTGMDMDSPVYQRIRSIMINMTKEVMPLMNYLKEEKEKGNPEENQTLNNEVIRAIGEDMVSVSSLRAVRVEKTQKFLFPKDLFNKVKDTENTTVTYRVPTVKFQEVKTLLDVRSASDVGRATFDYYVENEL